jgi:signal transduction histidine kinase
MDQVSDTHYTYFYDDRRSILQKLDWRLRLKDPQLQKEFFQFCRHNKLLFILKTSIFFTGLVVILSSFASFMYNHTVGEWIFSFLMLFTALSATYFGWYIVHDCSNFPHENTTDVDNDMSKIALYQIIHFLSAYLFIILVNTRSLFFSDCSSYPSSFNLFLMGWRCGFNHHEIPVYCMSGVVMIPIIIVIVLNEIHMDILFLATIINAAIFVIMASFDNIAYVWSTIWYVAAVMVMLIELHIFRVGNFLSHRKLQETLIENERMHEEAKASELRSMIGNLAHDLKTPLSSFMVGIDMIGEAVSQLEGVTSALPTVCSTQVQQVQSSIDTIRQCFKSISNTHAFMLMTINRCIDYTKASRGLKLAPKYDTIDLLDTLSMPLECMRNIQERIGIQLLPVSREICSHIITDKQWLQENVLCLLSNAVKYSSSGTVTIRISLVDVANEGSIIAGDGNESIVEKSSLASSFIFPTRISISGFSLDSASQIHPYECGIEDAVERRVDDLKESLKCLQLRKSNSFVSANYPVTQHLRCEIEDHGIGLTEEGMKNLFNPFQRAQRLAGGTG